MLVGVIGAWGVLVVWCVCGFCGVIGCYVVGDVRVKMSLAVDGWVEVGLVSMVLGL